MNVRFEAMSKEELNVRGISGDNFPNFIYLGDGMFVHVVEDGVKPDPKSLPRKDREFGAAVLRSIGVSPQTVDDIFGVKRTWIGKILWK